MRRQLIIFAVSASTSVSSAANKDSYVAAVWQNSGLRQDWGNVTATQDANLRKFDEVMGTAKAQGAQIIVFSEGGITKSLWNYSNEPGFVYNPAHDGTCEPIPDVPNDGLIVPCSEPAALSKYPVAYTASCLAKKHSMVMVIDTCDKQICSSRTNPPCPSSGYELFNTQVAFGEDGSMLAKYHKMHNYDTAPAIGESQNLCCWPPRPDPTFFDTSFGVRFGMHICFDIMFRSPAAAMALDGNIRDFVFSTHWETPGPPMLPAIEVQQGWSRGVGVNLLAADAGEGYANAGSGIYSKGKALGVRYRPNLSADDYLLVAKVPKIPQNGTTKHHTRSAVGDDGVGGGRRSSGFNGDGSGYSGNSRTKAPKPHRASPAVDLNVTSPTATAPPIPPASFKAIDFHPSIVSQKKQIVSAVAQAGSFKCDVNLTVAQNVTATDRFMLMAVSGSWMAGVLHSRSCVLFRCFGTAAIDTNTTGSTSALSPNHHSDSHSTPTPPSPTLLSPSECAQAAVCTSYSCGLYESAASLEARTVFSQIEMSGSFVRGDVVLPMVGTTMGQIVDHQNISTSYLSELTRTTSSVLKANAGAAGGGAWATATDPLVKMTVQLSEPLLNAMLFAYNA